jgi:hypothetical protein
VKIILLFSVLLIGGVLGVASCQTSRAGYESAPYEVVRSDGKFEVRDYPAMTVVETTMVGENGDGSFRRLFGFITGRNANKEKIAMTTPVFMAGSDTGRTMAFVMPAKMKMGDVPQPADVSVVVRDIAAGRFAVLSFSGGRSDEREEESLGHLETWIAKEGFQSSVSPIYGYFDPPWTPSFLRRNEVMLRVK